MEETMAHAYTRASNLRAILLRAGCPEVITNCKDAFKKLLSAQNRNSLETMMRTLPSLASGQTPPIPSGRITHNLPPDVLSAFEQSSIEFESEAYILSDITLRGLTYSVSTKHLGNSCVIISRGSHRVPAQIRHIIQFDDEHIYLAIRRHKRTPWQNDQYSRYSGIGATLWTPMFKDLEIIPSTSLICHFAYLPIIKACNEAIAVLPLWRGA